ncbi:MAG: site-specific integrase [Nocardioidaceae bacterium]|nr:site-specific integrase [Nocardioidaceae bacterium]
MTKTRTDGEGSIYQRHSPDCSRPTTPKGKSTCKCRWQGALVTHYIGEGSKKRAVRRKVSATTESGAATKLRELREQLLGDDLPDVGSITVEAWMTHWYKRIVPRHAKPLTIASYHAKVEQYIIPLLGRHRLDKLTPEHIEDAWDRLREEGNPTLADPTPLSANTIHQTHRILSRALKVAVQRKKMKRNPAAAESMDAPKRVEQPLEIMTPAEIDAVLATCRGKWNAARWNVALAIGLRQGEALGLRWEDVDLDVGTISVRQTLMRITGRGIVFGTPKSEKSKRTVALPTSLLAALKAHRMAQNTQRLAVGDHWTDRGLVFTLEDGRPLDPSVDAGRWRQLLKDAGVRHYKLHSARHSAGTMMLEQGVDVRVAMAILGHSQLSVTMRYQHVVDKTMRDAADKMDVGGRWG